MSQRSELKDLESHIVTINDDCNYWFIRTIGGAYFNEFVENNFIAIGYNDVSLEDVREALKNGDKANSVLKERIKRIYKEKEKRSRFAASQLLKFVAEIKPGDIIIIPSEDQKNLHLAE
jgi:predicted Mrr-cat superfamily restriction endonuclease